MPKTPNPKPSILRFSECERRHSPSATGPPSGRRVDTKEDSEEELPGGPLCYKVVEIPFLSGGVVSGVGSLEVYFDAFGA